MKLIYVVFSITQGGKHHAFADAIRTGENLKSHIDRYPCDVCHLCESRQEAETLARVWNESYKANGTNLY